MDPLSDVLRAVRLDGAHFFLVEAAGAWSVSAVAAHELAPRILPRSEHLISYHVVLQGGCWGGLTSASQVELTAGDVIVFPHGDAHVMSSDEGMRFPGDRLDTSRAPYPEIVRLGNGSGQVATLVCGFLGCDARPFNPLLASLPAVLHLKGIAEGWLSIFPRHVLAESRARRVGAESMLTRMAELMFVEVVRRHLEQLAPAHTGWMAGLRDAVVGPALAELHHRPAHPWTLESLARTIASSRTVLAERFSQLVGVPPMAYLARWRLQLAAEQLTRSSNKVASIGAQVGYQSEAAFSRAFKRETGYAPADWRRLQQPGSVRAPELALART